jgi:hypothetical protein
MIKKMHTLFKKEDFMLKVRFFMNLPNGRP